MNLYLISQTENRGYDRYDAAVVIAETEDEARNMHPMDFKKLSIVPKDKPLDLDDWTIPKNVKVIFLGIAANEAKPGIVLASFNAG